MIKLILAFLAILVVSTIAMRMGMEVSQEAEGGPNPTAPTTPTEPEPIVNDPSIPDWQFPNDVIPPAQCGQPSDANYYDCYWAVLRERFGQNNP